MSKVSEPFPIFYDDDGTPLEDGMIYIGTAGEDARENPIQAYWDVARTIAADQPIRTLGGRPAYQGAPASFYVAETSYSVLVLDRFGSLVTQDQNASPFVTAEELGNLSGLTIRPVRVGASETLSAADAGGFVRCANISPITLTIPPISAENWATGAYMEITPTLTGQITLDPGSGVTLRARDGALSSAGQYAIMTARHVGSNEWFIGGDIISDSPPTPPSSISADGWQLTVTSPVDLSFTPVPVTRAGFDITGTATTYADTLYQTKRVRNVFPDQASFTTDKVAVSDYIYAADTVASVTNNSTLVSPKPIATWGMMDRTLVGNSIAWEIIPFHRDAREGRQVVCVRVRATDGTNTTAWQTVSAVTLSSSCETPQQPEVFAGTLDITALNNDSLITLQGEVYPWFGVSASVLASNTETEFRFTNRFFYKNTTRVAAPNIICVASTGNDATGVVSTLEATAAATPCLTVLGAIARASSLLGTANRNVLSGLEVRIIDTVAQGTMPFQFNNQDAAAIKVTRASTSTRAAAVMTFSGPFNPYPAGNNQSPQLSESAITFEDMTITRSSNTTTFSGIGGRALHVQLRNVALNWGSFTAASGLLDTSHLSVFGMTATNYIGGLNYSTSGDRRIMRGVSGSFNNSGIDTYNLIGCSLAAANLATTGAQRGFLVYNNLLPSVPTGSAGMIVGTTSAGQNMAGAVVQNVVPNITTGGDPTFRIAGDSDNGNIVHLVMHQNTSAGVGIYGRYNVIYDDTPGTPRTHTLVSFKGNLTPQINTKGDVFMSDGSRIGNFAFHHGVGCTGAFARGLDANGGGLSFGQAWPGIDSVINGGNILFTDDRSTTLPGPVAGTTGGTYTLQAGSPARDRFTQYLLARDFAGTARVTAGTIDAGAYA